MGIPYNPNPFGGLLGFPLVPPPSPIATILGGANQKPRSRSEWEDRFAFWQKPASDTEEKKIAAAANRIRRAMRHSTFLPQRNWTIVRQGSHHNNTNTRSESDIDLGVCLTDAFFVEGPQNDWPTMGELGREPLPFQFDQYKTHIALCLEQEFGKGAVTIGKKAIHLHKNDSERINADVIPAYTFQRYGPRAAPFGIRGTPDHGIGLITADGKLITNFPEQHYRNGCAKNDRTGRRYKSVVRTLKRLRNHMAENVEVPQSARDRAKVTASFLIESLVYNCPDSLFGHAVIYDDVVAVLQYLGLGLNDKSDGSTLLTLPRWAFWQEVNEVKGLFATGQAWGLWDATAFIDAARAYMSV